MMSSTLLLERKTSATAMMEACLARIRRDNGAINAIVALRPEAELLAAARQADRSAARSWLHGVPFAVKDLVEVRGFTTTQGSPLFKDHISPADDPLAAALRRAGVIFIGKTNTSEFGLGSHTYNPVYGATRNPHNTGKSAGGSSGGAAAAIAGGMLPVADGSDMMGSLRNPAAFNHIYGLRPTPGLFPEITQSAPTLPALATSGPLAATPRDLARLFGTLTTAAVSRLDFFYSQPPAAAIKRIGWIGDWNGYFPIDPEILQLCRQTLDSFSALGAEIDAVTPPFPAAQLWESWLCLRSSAINQSIGLFAEKEETRKQLKPEAIWEIENSRRYDKNNIRHACNVRRRWLSVLEKLFQRYDFLAMPSAQLFPFDAALKYPATVCGIAMQTYHQWMAVVVPVSLAGIPAINIPAGFGSAGLPTGLQLIAKPRHELALIQFADRHYQA